MKTHEFILSQLVVFPILIFSAIKIFSSLNNSGGLDNAKTDWVYLSIFLPIEIAFILAYLNKKSKTLTLKYLIGLLLNSGMFIFGLYALFYGIMFYLDTNPNNQLGGLILSGIGIVFSLVGIWIISGTIKK